MSPPSSSEAGLSQSVCSRSRSARSSTGTERHSECRILNHWHWHVDGSPRVPKTSLEVLPGRLVRRHNGNRGIRHRPGRPCHRRTTAFVLPVSARSRFESARAGKRGQCRLTACYESTDWSLCGGQADQLPPLRAEA